MIEENLYKSPLAEPEPRPANRLLFPPYLVFLMALVASVSMAVCSVGGIFVAAFHGWAIVPTSMIFAYAAASVWCWRLAMRIKRRELRR